MGEAKDRIIVVLDVDSVDRALALVRLLAPHVGGFKIGAELIRTMLESLGIPPDVSSYNLSKINELFARLGGKEFWGGQLDTREPARLRISAGARVVSGDRTAGEAIRNGADYVLVGASITAAPDPVAAAQKLAAEIKTGLIARVCASR